MRPHFTKTALALMACSSMTPLLVHAADWNGSYSADGQCFCVGEIPASLRTSIVATPVGGQTVSQVCDRVGEGPGLSLSQGLFNYPVYADPQCGHGPFVPGIESPTADCAGSMDGRITGSGSCQARGPRWALDLAYKRPGRPAAAEPAETGEGDAQRITAAAQTTKNRTGLLDKPVVSSMSVEVPDDASANRKKTLKATVISSASTAGRTPAKVFPPENFTGKSVIIDGQRYLQARDDMLAYGGAAGSRIILDDQVFLRDDGSIDPADLYRSQPVIRKARPAERPVENDRPVAASDTARTDQSAGNARSLDSRQIDARATSRRIAAERKRLQERKAATVRAGKLADAEALKLEQQRRLQIQSANKAAAEAAQSASRSEQSEASNAQATDRQIAESDNEAQARQLANEKEFAQRKALADSLMHKEQRQQAVVEAARQVKPSSDTAADADSEQGAGGVNFMSALRLPAEVRASSRNFDYLEALPVSYDVGGTGMMLEGSGSSHSRFHYIGRIGVTGNYQELMAGGGYYLTPASADRFTVVLLAGVEYGNFELVDDTSPALAVDFNDTGIFLGASSRVVINSQFELKAGVGYSSFFEGDAMLFGGGYFHMTRQLDLVTRFEVGDNDLLGIGVRFYY
ncbi:MAG: hypothetical protein HKN42_07640 [Granulosicoccus sp.]|nr:hypothetical protein [Granulosicoccus sp.]